MDWMPRIRLLALPEYCLLIRSTRLERRQSADQLKPRNRWVRAAAVEIGLAKLLSPHRSGSRTVVAGGLRSTVMAVAHTGLRSTVRGSSTSSSMTSLGKGVAVISVMPSKE